MAIACLLSLFMPMQAQDRAGATEEEYGNIVVYLETASWGQDSPYNKLCFTSNGSQAITGCVPTAYAILMHYHKWPISAIEKKVYHSGTGESITLGHVYDWDNMLSSYSGTYTDEEANAVATLMRDLGWAYGVEYGTGNTASGAGGEGAAKLIDIFKYKSESPNTSSATMATNRDVLANDNLWVEYIKQSLDAGCPIPYSSTTTGGGRHIFILDGYTDKGYFHFNWGWNGHGNGWFKLDEMKPDAYSDYSKSHRAYFMLKPDVATYTISVAVNEEEAGSAAVNDKDKVTVNEGASITLTATANEGYVFVNWTLNGEEVSSNSTYTTTATADAEYTANFKKSEGSTTPIVPDCNIPSDNTLRYYRLAIPVTYSAFVKDLNNDYNNVLQFWRECEEFVNRMFVPLGFCFNVVEDQRLVKPGYFLNEDSDGFIYTLQANGTSNTDDLIGADSYDVGMWVHHRDITAENSGLSVEGGVYSSSTKGSGYSKTDKWVVAHELGHMFGAPHTTTGEGSLMDSGGDDFFSYPSIKKIRDLAVEKGAGSANNAVKVSNSAPVFVNANMKDSYKIPQGACIAIPVYANDADGNILTYSAIGCSSSTVGNVVEGGVMPHFASLIPQTDNVIDYRPKFTADIYYDDFYYSQDGTDIPAMDAGSYNIAILVNDMPSDTEYDYLASNPFYSNYAVWDATVEVVGGTEFKASISPTKNSYQAGEQVTIRWGVNSNYFTADSRLRITMSTDYGKTFNYILAESVPALDGNCILTIPDVNVGNIDVDFRTAIRSMRGGIIRIEEVGGVAYTLTTLSPSDGGGFNITADGTTPEPVQYTVTTTANPVAGGTATFAVGTAPATTSASVASGTLVTLYAVANDGYRFVNWTKGGTTVNTNAIHNTTVTEASDFIANFEAEQQATKYPTPTGDTYTNNYLTSITTTGGDTNIDYSAYEHPGQSLIVVPGKVQLERGQSFTMNLIANSLGEGNYNIVREDMRYCHASFFTDFDQDFTFQKDAAQTWGNQPPTHNVYGNYDYVMNITHAITVPDDAPTGESHVRMIYTNAWENWPTNGTAELNKGIVYDIVVEVVEKVDITANASEGGYVTINGETTETKRVIKGSNVTVNAIPADGYKFLNWSDTNGIASETAEYSFTANSATSLTANFEKNAATGIDDVEDENREMKAIYDLTGRKVENPTKGIYIINGKKVLVK